MKNEDIEKTRGGQLLGNLLPGLEPDPGVDGPQVQHQGDERIVKYHGLLRGDTLHTSSYCTVKEEVRSALP
jgi:hypothetical protein